MPTSEERLTEVSSYFGEHATSWRTRYGTKNRTLDDWEYQTRGRIALEWLAELLPSGGGRLLEVGCGAGVQSAAAAQQGWTVTSVDFAPEMLLEAQKLSQKPTWITATVEALPFRPHSYDVVLMNGVIGYLKDPLYALQKVQEQLRPGGKLIVSWASPHPLLFEAVGRAVSIVPDAVYLGLKRMVTGKPNPDQSAELGFYDQYLKRWTPEGFYSLLESANFAIDQVRSQNFGRFRFMDRPLWPERMDIWLSECLDRLAGAAPPGRLRNGARTHIALVTPAKS